MIEPVALQDFFITFFSPQDLFITYFWSALIILVGASYALLFAWSKVNPNFRIKIAAYVSYAVLILSVAELTRAAQFHGYWLIISFVMVIGYFFAPIGIWHFCVKKHAVHDLTTTEGTHKHIWTEEIKSQDSLLSVNLREVWHYRDLLLMLVKKEFITFYKQTILGPIWFFIQPILTMAIYVVLFGKIAKLSTDGIPQIAFYLAGITIWNYFSEALTKTSTVFKDNAAVFGKVYFPRLIMPLSIVCSGLMKFAIQFGLFIFVVLYYALIKGSVHPNIWVLATPFLILLMAAFALGLGMIFSSLTTKYKDLIFLLTFGIQLAMYATPVVYPVSAMPEKYKWIIEANPLTGIFECFRYGYLGAGNFEASSLGLSTLLITILLIIGVIIFNKVEKSFMDTV